MMIPSCSQVEELLVHVAGERGVILMGDLNALCADDYDRPEWQQLAKRRAESRWEPPKDRLLKLLKKK
jgi:hypothetical protein